MSSNSILIIKPYFSTILNLNKELHKQETLIEFYKIKCNNLTKIIEKKKKEIEEEEINLTNLFISKVEKEDFFINSTDYELKDIIEKAKNKKKNYEKKKDDYNKLKKTLEQKRNNLNLKMNKLSIEQLELFNLIKDIIINNINIDDENNELIQKYDKKIINENKNLIKRINEKCLEYKKNIDSLQKEINNKKNTKQLHSNKLRKRSLQLKEKSLSLKNSFFNINNEISTNYNYNPIKNLDRSKNNSSLSSIPINNNISSFIEVNNNNHNLTLNMPLSSKHINTNFYNYNNSDISIKNLNKSFYLLRNKRIEDDSKYSLNISHDIILYGNLCTRLLNNYKRDLRLIESLSPSDKNKNKKRSHSNTCSHFKKIEDKENLKNEIFFNNKYYKQNTIDFINESDSGIVINK